MLLQVSVAALLPLIGAVTQINGPIGFIMNNPLMGLISVVASCALLATGSAFGITVGLVGLGYYGYRVASWSFSTFLDLLNPVFWIKAIIVVAVFQKAITLL